MERELRLIPMIDLLAATLPSPFQILLLDPICVFNLIRVLNLVGEHNEHRSMNADMEFLTL